MFSSPMFRWEYRSATRGRRSFVIRASVAILFASVALGIGMLVLAGNTSREGALDPARIALLGRSLFCASVTVELVLMVFFVPAHVAGTIAEERARNTLPLLLLTRLSPIEIVVTKMVGRWLPTISLVLIGLPVLVAGA